MSSYLNFYLVPKKERSDIQKPLLFNSYSRSSDIYQAYYENIIPAFIGNDDERHYTELTKELSEYLVCELKKDIDKTKKNFEAKMKAYKELPKLEGEALDSYLEEATSTPEYINKLESTLHFAEFINNIIDDLEYSDFEKLLINID